MSPGRLSQVGRSGVPGRLLRGRETTTGQVGEAVRHALGLGIRELHSDNDVAAPMPDFEVDP